MEKPRCLIGCSGSVATLKLPQLMIKLSSFFEIKVIGSNSANFFLKRADLYDKSTWNQFISLKLNECIYFDQDEWVMWEKVGDVVLHIELRRWADFILIAPGSADLIAKLSYGLSDNLLLSTIRAWDYQKKCYLCPAMNTYMWDNPLTSVSINILKGLGWEILGPIEKVLACKDVGNGAMMSVDDIVQHIVNGNITTNKDYNVDTLINFDKHRKLLNITNKSDQNPSYKPTTSFLTISLAVGLGMIIGFTIVVIHNEVPTVDLLFQKSEVSC